MALRRLRRALAYALVSWHVVVRYYTLFGHYCWRIFRQTRNRMGYSFRLIVASSANKQFVHQLRKVPDVLLPCLTRDLRMFAEMGA
jgi:hypothetical protein